jgi:hypothetical protein
VAVGADVGVRGGRRVNVLVQVVGIAVGARPGGLEIYGALVSLLQLTTTAAPVLLGILAIVLAMRSDSRPPARRHPVQVYPPAS